MSYFTPFIIVRWGLALIAGIVFARLLRKPVRVVVTRMIPIQKRIEDNFYKRLTRITTVVGIVLALTVATLTNYGILRLAGGWEQTEQVDIQPLDDGDSWTPETFLESPLPASRPVEELNLMPSIPEIYEATPAEPEITPMAPMPAERTPAPGRFYLQLYAFQHYENALRQVQVWPGGELYRCHLAFAPGEDVPYKILIGPFSSRDAARQFRRRKGLSGFPRPADRLEFQGD